MASRVVWGLTIAAVAAAGGPAPLALAHDGRPLEPHDLWSAWSWPTAVPLAVAALAYGRGVHTVWRRAGTGRGVRRWQVGAFSPRPRP